MRTLRRALLVLAALAAIGAAAYWLHATTRPKWRDEIALACVGVALLAVVAFRLRNRSKCRVARAYLTLSEHDGRVKFSFQAHVSNDGSAADTLERIQYTFYHRAHGVFPLVLLFGGGIDGTEDSQILPLPLNPGTTYLVSTSEGFLSASTRARRLQSWGKSHDDYFFRCKFVFQHAPPILVRVHPYDETQPDHVAASLLEQRLGIPWMKSWAP